MTLAITSIYAALLALLFLVLSGRVILYRRSHKISLGDTGDKALLKRMRAQANCAEYAPMGILLLAMAEAQGAPAGIVHGLGLALLAGRVLHAVGFSSYPQIMIMRQSGMGLTLLMIGLTALGLLGHALL